VVDDLLAITVIALFYTDDLELMALGLALVPLALFALLVQRRIRHPLLLLPLALLTWGLVHESGVHATVAAVLLAFTVPVHRRDGRTDAHGLAEQLEHRIRPLSAGFAVPVFAFFASGVTIGGVDGLSESLSDPAALGVILGLVIGKPIGITGSAWLLARFTKADLDEGLSWVDVVGLSMLAGVGFTVSLLIGELAFGGTVQHEHVIVGVLMGSLIASMIATMILRSRNRAYRRINEEESVDSDLDGVPDVYQRDDPA
jgi:NhaA family Na+:H+ antiporter